jgi:TetR/AcrR family transcriptional repressor of nem operon
MAKTKPGMDRKEQIVSAAIDRLSSVGFEGFRVGDVARDVGINNATLIHHYRSKVALIKAVVERFTQRFEAVADAANTYGTAQAKLARHMQSSIALMRTSPEMFVVLNEIMIKGCRDPEISHLVSVPLLAWHHHIASLLMSPTEQGTIAARRRAEEIATTCMAQLLGLSLLFSSTNHADSPFEHLRDQAASHAMESLTKLAEGAL